ncbi:MAG: glutamine-hydrolyzing carbamoyl-phosphate synthase small subunit [Acidobacteriia bacterium]|nr:glutamine-hydrolyzing carbamoyl-phosphate synthase small subunit [Terriglobia bacterium]
MEAILALEDGRAYRGRAFGASGERTGEVVFNTSMTGYQEILTDPSYKGQIVVMTCPEIGNTGANPLDHEADRPMVEGFAVREYSRSPSNWRANQDLHQYLREHGVVAISEIDTRAITRRIRTVGALRGVLSTTDRVPDSLVRKAKEAPQLEDLDLVRWVTCERPHSWSGGRARRFAPAAAEEGPRRRIRCVAYDLGAKRNLFRLLHEAGFEVIVVPATTGASDALRLEPEAVFLSNGPGDPRSAGYVVDTVRGLLGRVPMFGICLGHQVAGLALGGRTFKLKFGHRGANHPVKDLRTGRVAVTSQNHGYSVVPESLPAGTEVTHLSLNDGTCEGFVHRDARLLAVQFHPEASPGPHDSLDLFREFRAMVPDRGEPGRIEIEGHP